MGRIILTCKFITPAFIYGANNELELRAPSIKGLIRFWWRAVNQFENIKEMRNKEAEIFGGKKLLKDGKEKFIKAKVQILTQIIKESKPELNKSLLNKYEPYDGIRYLFYSMICINSNRNKKYFHKGTKFQVIFKFKDKDKHYINEYLKAFNVLQLFGGIGGRIRKGAGNFVVEKIDGELCGISREEILESLYEEDSGKDILEAYKNIFKQNRSTCKLIYSNVVDELARVYLLTFHNKALESKNYYEDKPFAILKELIDNFDFEENLNKVAKRYKDCRKKTEFNKCIGRGASPLIIKVVKDGEECSILLVKLSGERVKYYEEKDKSKGNSSDNENNKLSKEDELNEEDKIVDEFFQELIKENNKNGIRVINLRG